MDIVENILSDTIDPAVAIYRMTLTSETTYGEKHLLSSEFAMYNRYLYFGKYHCGFGSITERFVMDFWPIVK